MGHEKNPKKLKARQLKNTQQKAYREKVAKERERRAQYPEVYIDSAGGDPDFVKVVREARDRIDFDDPSLFTNLDREFYRRARSQGWSQALAGMAERLAATPASEDRSEQWQSLTYDLHVGSALYTLIPEEVRRNFLPYNDVHVARTRRILVLKLASMKSAKGAGGRIYYSRYEPKITLNGQEYVAAFSRHAVDRICQRYSPRYLQYAAAGDVHALLANCVYFEPAQMPNGEPAFVLYAECGMPPFAAYHTFVEGILGKDNVESGKGPCYYRLGYCPVAAEGRFAKAITFLYPGYNGTPEHQLVRRSALTQDERATLTEQCDDLTADDILIRGGDGVLKWFHDHGIPQVVQMSHKVFELLGQ